MILMSIRIKFLLLLITIFLVVLLVSCKSDSKKPGGESQPKVVDFKIAQNRMLEADQKIVIFGVDGLTWKKLNLYREKGLLPNFDKLIKEGASGKSQSINPMFSISLWTTIVTGVDFEKHGVSYFYKIGRNGTMLPYTSLDRKVKALWNIMNDVDEESGWVSWWGSWPAEPIKGFNITNYYIADFGFKDIQEASLFYPPEISEDLKMYKELYTAKWGENEADGLLGDVSSIDKKSLSGDYWSDYKYSSLNWTYCNKKKDFLYNFLRNVFRNDALAMHAGIDLMKKTNPRLVGIYLNGIDGVSHKFWKYDELDPNPFRSDSGNASNIPIPQIDPEEQRMYGKVLSGYYASVDRQLGEILNSIDEKTTVVIVSDHGFEYVPKSNYISLNYLLYELGYIQFKDDLEKVDLRKSLAHEITIKPWEQERFIRINVKANDFKDLDGTPLGAIMSGKEEADVRQRLVDDLTKLKLRNKDAPLFMYARKADPQERAQNSGQGDVVARFNRIVFDENFEDEIILPNGKTIPLSMVAIRNYHSGNHSMTDGVIIISGPLSNKGSKIEGANLFDVTPTILTMLALPVSKDMLEKGKVLSQAIDQTFLEKYPVQIVDSWGEFHHAFLGKEFQASESEQQVREMLQGLGYLQ